MAAFQKGDPVVEAKAKATESVEFLFTLGDAYGYDSPEVQSVRASVKADLDAYLDAKDNPRPA